jgi:Na+/phosphate symporter
MGSIVAEQLNQAGKAFFSDDKKAVELLRENERAVDSIHEKEGNYLHKISTLMLNKRDQAKKRALVHAVADLERIGDLAENIAEYARQDKIVFSDKAGQGEAQSGLFMRKTTLVVPQKNVGYLLSHCTRIVFSLSP